MIVVSLVVGGVVEVGAMDEEFTTGASVLTGAGGAGFLSLAEVEDSLVAEIVSLVTLNSEVEAGVATEGVDVGPLEVAVEVTVEDAEMVEVGTTSEALVAEVLDLVMVKVVS